MPLMKPQKLREMREGLGVRETCKRLTKAIKDKALHPSDFSIRDLAEGLIPDGREFVHAMNPARDTDGVSLLETVDSAAFKNITGQLLIRSVMDGYENPQFVGPRLAKTIPTDLNGEKIPGLTTLGDQNEIVGEGKPYPDAAIGEDWIETPETLKRGRKLQLTKEVLFFNKTGLILDQATELGYNLGLNRDKRIIDLALGVTNTYRWKGTAYDTYQTTTPWVNVNASNALADWSDIDDALQLFGALVDPTSGEPILVMPTQMIVHTSLRKTIDYIMRATQVVIDPNANAGTAQNQLWVPNNVLTAPYEIISSPVIDQRYTAGSVTSTTWMFGDFQRAFAYMENWPVQVMPMPSNSYIEYERDIVAGWRVSERGTVAVKNPRYTQRNIAAGSGL